MHIYVSGPKLLRWDSSLNYLHEVVRTNFSADFWTFRNFVRNFSEFVVPSSNENDNQVLPLKGRSFQRTVKTPSQWSHKPPNNTCSNYAKQSCAKFQSNHHHQQTTIQFFTGRMPFRSPNQQCQSTEWKYHISWTCLPQAHLGVFQLCLGPLIAPGYLGEGCHASHQPSDVSTQFSLIS